jgi:shikimate dehydrogenase
MNITGTTRVFFIFGDSVAQVRAPAVYNHLFQQHGIDAVLVPLKLAQMHNDMSEVRSLFYPR